MPKTATPGKKRPKPIFKDHPFGSLPIPGPGRPTLLTPELGVRIGNLIAEGKSVFAIGEMEGMPAAGTIFRWLATHKHDKPEVSMLYDAFREVVEAARKARAQLRVEQAAQLYERVTEKDHPDRIDPNSARVGFIILDGLMAMEDRTKWGKQSTVTIQGNAAQPVSVQRVDLTDEELMALARGGMKELTG